MFYKQSNVCLFQCIKEENSESILCQFMYRFNLVSFMQVYGRTSGERFRCKARRMMSSTTHLYTYLANMFVMKTWLETIRGCANRKNQCYTRHAVILFNRFWSSFYIICLNICIRVYLYVSLNDRPRFLLRRLHNGKLHSVPFNAWCALHGRINSGNGEWIQ